MYNKTLGFVISLMFSLMGLDLSIDDYSSLIKNISISLPEKHILL